MKKIPIAMLGALLLPLSLLSQEVGTDPKNHDNWQVRIRGLAIAPDEDASIESIGGEVDISTAVIPELDFTYFFTEHWAAELILGTSKHDVEAIGTAAGNMDLGHVWLLPPTLTLQYHITGQKLRPYLGAGINYTLFYGSDEGPVADGVDYENSTGLALQLGVDYELGNHWFLNMDLKKIFLSTDATIDANTVLGATVGAEVDIDPLLVGIGLGYRF